MSYEKLAPILEGLHKSVSSINESEKVYRRDKNEIEAAAKVISKAPEGTEIKVTFVGLGYSKAVNQIYKIEGFSKKKIVGYDEDGKRFGSWVLNSGNVKKWICGKGAYEVRIIEPKESE